MRYLGRVIGAGDALYVPHEGEWVDFIISDWSEGTGDIYGRRIDGPYERMPRSARFDIPPPPPLRAPKVALAPKLADLERQNMMRLGEPSSAIYVMPSHRRR